MSTFSWYSFVKALESFCDILFCLIHVEKHIRKRFEQNISDSECPIYPSKKYQVLLICIYYFQIYEDHSTCHICQPLKDMTGTPISVHMGVTRGCSMGFPLQKFNDPDFFWVTAILTRNTLTFALYSLSEKSS